MSKFDPTAARKRCKADGPHVTRDGAFCQGCLRVWPCDAYFLSAALEALEEAQEENKQLREEIDHWVQAYSSDIVVYPSAEAIRAVNKTPEFIVGRNAMMQAIHEGLSRILRGSKEDE